VLLSRYLFFLTQRPISRSNTHYLRQRIHGLQSLGLLLAADGDEELTGCVRLLQTLDPRNVYEVAERLQLSLVPFARAELPDAYICADAPPPPEFIGQCERILLVLGPAIGIGDEIVVFPLPSRIKRTNPNVEVTTLTAYEGLWEGVEGVERIVTYRDHAALVAAMRGEGGVDKPDVVLFVDFENPELYRAIAGEAEIDRYVELSIGARLLAAVDNRERWAYHQALPTAYFRNVYDGFDELARRLGVVPDPTDRMSVRARIDAAEGELTVFVSPFSSKYDPSARYWSMLISELVPEPTGRAVRFVLDPGPNATTRRLAADIVRSAAARSRDPAVSCALASSDGRGGLSLPGVFAELERAGAAVCADSYAAHAAPRLGCTTLVVASPGLENWRTPGDRSFYFDADRPIREVAAGMREVLRLHGISADQTQPSIGDAEHRLAHADLELGRALANGAGLDELWRAYELFGVAQAEVGGRVAAWPPLAAALARDRPYDFRRRAPNSNGAITPELERDTRRFVQNYWLVWRTTNLRKYLEARLQERGA
jgi:ADP-heptose:LPS heptosyltransferase